jgi:hypothetical protein
MDEDAKLISNTILFGNDSRAGFLTNPKTKDIPSFIEVNGEKIVCLAKGGECRYNSRYYGRGLNSIEGWTTPIIDKDCPDRCAYKVLVCDNHPKGECESSITYYPQYNKFRGEFKSYCKEFSKLENKTDDKK